MKLFQMLNSNRMIRSLSHDAVEVGKRDVFAKVKTLSANPCPPISFFPVARFYPADAIEAFPIKVVRRFIDISKIGNSCCQHGHG